jgi:hypothetical protein
MLLENFFLHGTKIKGRLTLTSDLFLDVIAPTKLKGIIVFVQVGRTLLIRGLSINVFHYYNYL